MSFSYQSYQELNNPTEQLIKKDTNNFNDLTYEDLMQIAYPDKNITLYNIWYEYTNKTRSKFKKVNETKITYTARNGRWFSCKELMDIIIKFDLEDRPKSLWFGGIDAHHIYFDGLQMNVDGSYRIQWGS